ncbi:hypothetical protein IX317_001652 [Fusobacterium sp. DD29]|uniref:SHOCT domain-containing protein n=1 Tax=unclassified Fusobacterium TaxID=2648384 RepID=UPI001B8AE36C|nr:MULTISPECIES: SHOCT domain-containing protein [unclassified Fusobacterium]MBR8749972.1 hypothetical protein [Fusobacterium sp. DD29]MBR8762215.1 hypothetical protein [Fusobacterium sp. DD25]MBR8768231.1 hypothetical protein [Fusobacterium sp. DD43]MBR8772307.1 hypothetical protein [Fusobacterium sp. DD40]MBR8776526.1 hypothetical protein [Fusobacterium sp. DD17]
MFGFGKKEKCSICNTEVTKKKLADGYICNKCIAACGNYIDITKGTEIYSKDEIEYFIKKAKQDQEDISKFKATRKVGKYIEFDDDKKKFLIPKKMFIPALIYDYNEISEFELIEDGETVSKGGLGRAIVGGALLGGVGAIVGGVTGGKKTKTIIKNLAIKIVVSRKSNPVITIPLLIAETKKDSFVYRAAKQEADEILAILGNITKSDTKEEVVESHEISVTDEIRKYKILLDEGILTQEEFEAKKKQLLGI